MLLSGERHPLQSAQGPGQESGHHHSQKVVLGSSLVGARRALELLSFHFDSNNLQRLKLHSNREWRARHSQNAQESSLRGHHLQARPGCSMPCIASGVRDISVGYSMHSFQIILLVWAPSHRYCSGEFISLGPFDQPLSVLVRPLHPSSLPHPS
jgi:hypothetical protein